METITKSQEPSERETEIAVPEATLKEWKIEVAFGDKSKMVEQKIGTKAQIALAFRGFAIPSLIEGITNYFKNKNAA